MNDKLEISTPMGNSQFSQVSTVRIPLRPLFAAVAMNGLLANPTLERLGTDPSMSDMDAITDAAWLMADAMLKWGNEKPQEDEVQNGQ